MARRKKSVSEKPIEQYEHKDKKRLNNPPVGLVTPQTDKDGKKKTYQYDPHLDPQLQWAGKAEHTSFEVPTVSLHVHERIDPKTIIESAKKEKKGPVQMSLFAQEERPLREAIEFYKHKDGWTNRLIAGDSLLVMNSLLEKEGMGGKIQMIYIDPPYGIKYGSNFQPFVNKRDVKDGKDEDLTAEPEMIKAFRDTWELGIHSYLTYLRDRLLLAKELLHESGSVFVQISDENIHYVRKIMDEVFEIENFISIIQFKKTAYQETYYLANVCDFIIWYSKDRKKGKCRNLFKRRPNDMITSGFTWLELENGTCQKAPNELSDDLPNSKRFQSSNLTSQGYSEKGSQPFEFNGVRYEIGNNKHWKTHHDGLKRLGDKNRLFAVGKTLTFKRYEDDFPYAPFNNMWNDTVRSTFASSKIYIVETNTKVVERCLNMTTDPGDLVLDITCGSGLKYKTVPHLTLKSIANNEPPAEETLYDQPLIDTKKTRITGPFTVEAVPSPVTKSLEDIENEKSVSDESVVHSGETLRQNEWREELMRTGVRAKGGKMIEFSRVELLPGTRFLHAEAETREGTPKKVLVSFGPEHAPLEQRQVEEAWQEARQFRPDILLFAAFQFDEEASKDIDEMKPETAGMQFIKAQMNADLLTDDLKKRRSNNESFWLIGQPDIKAKEIKKGADKGKIQIEVLGFDYYNPITGDVESGGKNNITMWMLDTDYDNRSLFPSQVFFPMAGEKDGWTKLAKNLKAEIDEEKIEAFKGTVSLPFKKSKSCQVAVKIIDDRGIESLRIIRL